MTLNNILRLKAPNLKEEVAKKKIKELSALMQKTQQALWLQKKRAIVILEGFDAAGKGTCIRHLTEGLDPRSLRVIPIGVPTEQERGQHYLQRFWKNLPDAGCLTVFDRSWYGRVLVEKVEKLAPPYRLAQAYQEINAFEKMLTDDGIVVIKIFLVVSKDEQLKRFKARLMDPFKNWKITEEDVRNRRHWDEYVKVANTMVLKCPGWTMIRSDDKDHARVATLETVTKALRKIHDSYRPAKARINKLSRQLVES